MRRGRWSPQRCLQTSAGLLHIEERDYPAYTWRDQKLQELCRTYYNPEELGLERELKRYNNERRDLSRVQGSSRVGRKLGAGNTDACPPLLTAVEIELFDPNTMDYDTAVAWEYPACVQDMGEYLNVYRSCFDTVCVL